jgi:hypothetical protein
VALKRKIPLKKKKILPARKKNSNDMRVRACVRACVRLTDDGAQGKRKRTKKQKKKKKH